MSKYTKIIYFILFILLMVHPHFITGHILSVPRAYVQSFVNLLILIFFYIIYRLHQKDIQHKEDEKEEVTQALQESNSKLSNAFKYIGLANRRLPLLKNITTDLMSNSVSSKKDKKNIFYNLLAIAVESIIKKEWGLFRFVDNSSGKTVKEYVYTKDSSAIFEYSVSNQQLIKASQQLESGTILEDLHVVYASDSNSSIKCFAILPKPKSLKSDELLVLQSIVDQAQLFYRYLN